MIVLLSAESLLSGRHKTVSFVRATARDRTAVGCEVPRIMNYQIEDSCSIYLSNRRHLINRLFPTHKTKLQFLSLVRSRNLLIPMPEYAAASYKLKLLFSKIGTSFIGKFSFRQTAFSDVSFSPVRRLPVFSAPPAGSRLMSGEMLPAKLLAQLLRPVNSQAVVWVVTGVKADDVVMALYVLPLLVFFIAEIRPHTGNGKIFSAAVQRGNTVICSRYQPPVCVKDGLMVNSSCSNVRYFSASP